MAESRLPLLRGRISDAHPYRSPQQGGPSLQLPPVDAQAHRVRLTSQLDIIKKQVAARAPAARDELATREIIAIEPTSPAVGNSEGLASARADAQLIGTVPDTGTAILDVADPGLGHLRGKVADFADDTQVKTKAERDGTQTSHRAHERVIAPIAEIRLARPDDLRGPRLRRASLPEDRPYWYEIACRGGSRNPGRDTDSSRAQISRQIYRLTQSAVSLEEIRGPEQVYFYVRLTSRQMEALQAATDCIYEIELAPSYLRDIRLLDEVATKELKEFTSYPPPDDAPAVVLLDTGIATAHPLLQAAMLPATTVVPLSSPEDTYGHGTKMAGVSLYQDIGALIERGTAAAQHWIHSCRLLIQPGVGTAADASYDKWPVLTKDAVLAVERVDPRPRRRVFTLAVTRTMQDPPLDGIEPTLWSHAVDQLAYHDGKGRLLVVSAGNARDDHWLQLAQQYPQLHLSEKIHQPAQATNALTVGAFTNRIQLPPSRDYAEAELVAKVPGGISPYTSTGIDDPQWPVKPDIVMEGGNLAIIAGLPDSSVDTLCALTTSHRHAAGRPLGTINMTSEATARAAYLAARIWDVEPTLRPETVRGLIVHSAQWTSEMVNQFHTFEIASSLAAMASPMKALPANARVDEPRLSSKTRCRTQLSGLFRKRSLLNVLEPG